ncbi:centromere protein P isoform X2 [Neofelis nebulosa]|uniref:centromere protein P isoform X2 n=1 Tax=Neofelis nebulosa TaxID=61452 RepID=UPI00272C1CC1|nr:centromere protein P isoform X2 [Neofelis nebulosa]
MDARRAEVRALEAEIAALRRACEEPRAPGEDTSRARKSLQEVHQSDSGEWAASKDLRGHLGHLESELLFLSTLTGINIINYSMKTEDLTSTENTEKSIKKVLQRHRLSGNCHMITFQLEFQILEIQNKESLSSVITDLNIIMEPTEYSELSEFVSRAEDRRDLLMFFRSLHFFVEWCEYRKCTFEHFKEKYSEAVRLPEGAASSCMVVQSPRQPGFLRLALAAPRPFQNWLLVMRVAAGSSFLFGGSVPLDTRVHRLLYLEVKCPGLRVESAFRPC